MPWKVFRENGKFCLHKMNDGTKGELVHCHDSADMARRQQAALYVSEDKEISPDDAVIIDEDNNGAVYKDYYPEAPAIAYPSGATSFEELESERQALLETQALSELMVDYQHMVGNILYAPTEDDKVQKMDKLYSEFKQRVGQRVKEKPTLIDKVKDFLGIPQPSDIMVYKEEDGGYSWITSYSNKFIDRDNPPDILASTAHAGFVEKVDKGLAPLPVLELWHVPEWQIGYATALAYDDSGFPIAVGRFDDNKEAQEIAEWLSKQKDFGVSHGMWNRTIQRDPSDESVIIAYETHEISPLPRANAANLLADWYVIQNEVKEVEEVSMAIPEKKRQELLKRGIPEATLEALEERNRAKAEAASAEGVKSKEAEQPVAETEVEQPVPETPPSEAPAEEQPPAAAQEKQENKEETGVITPDLFPTRQEVADAIANVLAPKFEEFSTQIAELQDAFKETKAELDEFRASDEKRIKEIISMTPRDSLASLVAGRFTERASSSKQTKVGGNDKLLETKPAEEEPVVEKGRFGIPFIDKMTVVKTAPAKDGK